jgi:hypothetical protein
MSGVFQAVGKVAGIVASVAAFIPGGQVVAAAAAAVAAVASVGAALTATTPPKQGSASEITIGANMPSPYMMGDSYSGGARVHQVGYGPTVNKIPNPYLACADVYSVGGPIAGIDRYYLDFEEVTFDGGDEANGFFDNFLYRSFSTGPLLQSTALTSHWGAIPQWGSDAKLSGKAHVLWGAEFDGKGKRFASGFPQTGVRARGVLTWDPRADSTYPGGSGTQRWASPRDRAAFDAARATWAYTARPGLHALRYALGTWERDLNVTTSDYVLTFGIGMPLDQIVVADFVALENVCTANGWEVSGTITEPGDKWANLKRILQAGGAEPCWKGGRLGLKITSPRVSLDTIRRDDLAGPIRAQGFAAWRDRINTAVPQCTSPDHKWTLQPLAKTSVASFVAEDGEEKPKEMPVELCKSATQAAQLAVYGLYDTREFGPIDLQVLPRLRAYRGGDRLTLDPALVAELGYPHGEVVVVKRSFDPATMTGTLTLMGETAAKHSAALAATGAFTTPLTIAGPASYDAAAGGQFPRAAYRYLDRTPAFPVTSDDTTISIAALTQGTLDDGTTLLLPAGKRAGLASGQWWGVFWDLQGTATQQTATQDLTAGTLPTTVTLARASTGTYVTSSGALATAAANAPRFDYAATSPYALRGLLVEAAATNGFLQSQNLTVSWTALMVTPTATSMVETTGNGLHQVSQTVTFTAGQPVAISAIGGERTGSAKRYLAILVPPAVLGTQSGAIFDLATGAVTLVGTGISAAATPAPGGWLCRIALTPTATVAAGVIFRVCNAAGSVAAYTGDGASGLNLSELQFEAGSVATSRIRTTTAAVTRAADVVTLDWGAKGVPDGAITATVTFDDGSTQAIGMTVASGKAVLPTPLNRHRVRSVSASYTDQPYVVVPDAQIASYMADSRYVYVDRQATLTGGASPTDDTPPPGYGGGGGGKTAV